LPALRKLRLRDLETLDTLGRTRSFAKTAAASAVTQPALSKWLRELETAMGLALFERSTRRVATTPYGDVVLEAAARILGELERVEPMLDALHNGLSEPLVVGILPGLAGALMPPTMEHLLRDARAPRITLREASLDTLLPLAQRHELDVLVCRLDASARAAGLEILPLYQDDLAVLAAKDHPLALAPHATWRDTAPYPWVAPPRGSPMRAALEAQFAGAGLGAPIVIMESMSFQTNAELAQRLNCLFVSSRYDLTEQHTQSLCALEMALPGVAQRVGALYAAPCSAAVSTLLDAMKAATPAIGIAAGAKARC
jgi:DNA-binding transcriptional LysR family regulator